MTITETEALTAMKQKQDLDSARGTHLKKRRRSSCCNCCLIATGVIVLILILFIIIAVILAFTIFKQKDPKTQVISATVQGISPRISFPVIRIDLNITLDLNISVYNPNRASFKHGPGKSQLLYRGNQVGDVDFSPGNIPSRGSEIFRSKLVLDVDKIVSTDMSALISDVLSQRQVVLETRTRIPGRVTFLKIFKKHVVALSNCQITIKIPDLSISQQVCRNKAKF